MAHDAHLKRKALELRTAGLPLDDIVARLALPRTTVYGWVRELPIERTSKQSLAQQRGSLANKEKAQQVRAAAYQVAWEDAPRLLTEPKMRDFVVLYMAEGYRRSRHQVQMCNSNPHIMTLSHEIMLRFARHSLGYALQYHADHEPEELRAYWGELLAIDGRKIALARKSNSGELSGRQWRSEHGVLTIRAGDTNFRSQLQAWMDFIVESWHTVRPLHGV